MRKCAEPRGGRSPRDELPLRMLCGWEFCCPFLFTPLKRITPLCTLVGAIPGATPPLIGWAAARGRLDPAAWVLFAIVFLWQFPHFMSIAWMYREDYARAGYLVLPASDLKDRFVFWQCLLPALGLFVVGIVPTLRGHAGLVSFAGALVL